MEETFNEVWGRCLNYLRKHFVCGVNMGDKVDDCLVGLLTNEGEIALDGYGRFTHFCLSCPL